MPTKIQVALQGGGAKFIHLLAVAQALQALESSKKIEIIHVAGTSAGAIVAGILASRIPVSNVLADLRGGGGKELAAALTIGKKWYHIAKAVIRILSNRTAVDINPLSMWIKKIFKDRKLKDLPISCSILITDFSQGGARTAQDNDYLRQAVVDSSSIPFILSTWAKTGTFSADGGLCDNLPSAYLKKIDGVYSMAVGFEAEAIERPTSFFTYLTAVLNIALGASDKKARNLLPDHAFYPIKTDLDTLDFSRAFEDFLPENSFNQEAEIAHSWIENSFLPKAIEFDHLASDFWRSKSKATDALLEKIGALYSSTKRLQKPTHIERCRFTIKAFSLKEGSSHPNNVPDSFRYDIDFRVVEAPLSVMSISVLDFPDITVFLDSLGSHSCVNEKNERVSMNVLPMKATPGNPLSERQFCVFFDPPLAADSGLYRFSYSQQVKGMLGKLHADPREDDIVYIPTNPDRKQKAIPLVEYVLFVPNRYSPLASKFTRTQSEPTTMPPGLAEDGLHPHGWQFVDVPIPKKDDDSWGVRVILRNATARDMIHSI